MPSRQRPALASLRHSHTGAGLVRYTFKTPWRNGTTNVLFEPPGLIARLAALILRPVVRLTRYQGAPGVKVASSRTRSKNSRSLLPGALRDEM